MTRPLVNIGRPVVVVDKITREIIDRYDDYIEAADSMGVDHGYAWQLIVGETVPRYKNWCMRFEESFDPMEDFSGRNGPIYAIKDNRLRCFYSVTEAAKILGLTNRVVGRYVREGKGMGFEWGSMPRGRDALLEEFRGRNGE